MSPLRAALLAQLLGGVATLGLAQGLLPELWRVPLGMAALQGGIAAVASRGLKAPVWWLPIHMAFMPLVVLASRLDLNPAWYLAAFLALLAVFWRTDRSRVPLYLSNQITAAAVARLLPAGHCQVVDLGCGDGGLLKFLARARPDCDFVGIEHAPLPWLWARLSTRALANCHIQYGDFWRQPLDRYDLAYAFLSPAPMDRLGAKAGAEMRPGTWLVSNSFPVPGREPDQALELADSRRTRLFCYRAADR